MARRKASMSKQEAGCLIGLVAAFFLVFVKIIEYGVKALAAGVQYISDDISWANGQVNNYGGSWRDFYQAELNQKVFNYLAIITAIIGLCLIAYRPWAGVVFFGVSAISFLTTKNTFSGIDKNLKEIIITVLIGLGIVSNSFYIYSENLAFKKQKEAKVRLHNEEIIRQKLEALQLDSSNRLVLFGKEAFAKKKYTKANSFFDQALSISPNNENALYQKGLYYKEIKKFDKAISIFAQINLNNSNYEDALINQGLCLLKQGNEEQAVSLFRESSNLGNKQADKLYNKYNPLKRHIISYLTRCCDGSASPTNAKGRGACSHHGGVCNWNEPIYSESRKYE